MKVDCLYLLLRRVAAFLYDCLLLIALFFLLTAVAVFFNKGEAIESILYKLLLIPVAGLFFCWFWKQDGQTLGMRAWRIKLVNNDLQNASWSECVLRYIMGMLLFAVTLIYMLWDKQCLSLHDKFSKTKIVYEKVSK